MKHNEVIQIAVAESSVIVRSGVISVLKRLPNLSVSPLEISSLEGLNQCLVAHRFQILIVNPLFGGWFNAEEFKSRKDCASLKVVSLLCAMTDSNLLKGYDEQIQWYDDLEVIGKKLSDLVHLEPEEESESELGALSQREKEIVCCVVRGMTNKEIAEQLFLSIHTVITHRRNIARKLQIHSSAGLTIYAIVNKLVELGEVKMNL
ncbi:MAG: response regulator transcription factor [Phocaeicola sp.]